MFFTLDLKAHFLIAEIEKRMGEYFDFSIQIGNL